MAEFIELLFVLAILGIVFGARRVPRLGESVGRWLHRGDSDRQTETPVARQDGRPEDRTLR